jgi:hypothetical protein
MVTRIFEEFCHFTTRGKGEFSALVSTAPSILFIPASIIVHKFAEKLLKNLLRRSKIIST